jgi:hypothetical protein
MESLLKKCATTVTPGMAVEHAVEPRVLENTNGKVLTYGDKIPVTVGAANGEAK